MAALPGPHDLVKHLRRDGQPGAPIAVAPIAVRATGILPDRHDGSLGNVNDSPVGGLRWYWEAATALGVVWVGLLILMVRNRLRRRPMAAAVVPPATLAERLRPLVAAAAKGELDADGQGRLERLLLRVWRRRLGLDGVPVPLAVARMKAHAEAGQLLRAMEDWLHRPPGSRQVDEAELARLLAPYAEIPDDIPVHGSAGPVGVGAEGTAVPAGGAR